VLIVAPASTHGPVFEPGCGRNALVEPWTVRVWFVRLIGAVCIVGGPIYISHPPNRFG